MGWRWREGREGREGWLGVWGTAGLGGDDGTKCDGDGEISAATAVHCDSWATRVWWRGPDVTVPRLASQAGAAQSAVAMAS